LLIDAAADASARRSAANTQAKYLLLRHAVEAM
jgi:hypothetical protein